MRAQFVLVVISVFALIAHTAANKERVKKCLETFEKAQNVKAPPKTFGELRRIERELSGMSPKEARKLCSDFKQLNKCLKPLTLSSSDIREVLKKEFKHKDKDVDEVIKIEDFIEIKCKSKA